MATMDLALLLIGILFYVYCFGYSREKDIRSLIVDSDFGICGFSLTISWNDIDNKKGKREGLMH